MEDCPIEIYQSGQTKVLHSRHWDHLQEEKIRQIPTINFHRSLDCEVGIFPLRRDAISLYVPSDSLEVLIIQAI